MAAQDFSLLLQGAPSPKADVNPAEQPAAQQAQPAVDFSLLLSSAPDAHSKSDSLFDSLLWRESRGRQTNADGTPVTSKKGAIGIAQVMPATAPEAARLAGLEFDDIRYRTDADYNRTIGKAYFDKQLQDFGGDTAKALAAYNAGPGALRRAMQRADESGEPAAWMRFLPAETQAYVPAIMSKAGAAPQAQQQRRRDPYSNAGPAVAPSRTFGAAVNDSVIDAANAAAGLVKAGFDLFDPDSSASKFIDNEIIKAGQEKQSDYKKFMRSRLQTELADAGINDGSTEGEVAAEFRKAGVQLKHAITVDPLGTLSEAFGNIGPFAILGRGMEAAKLANGVRSVISSSAAAGLSAGEVRGNIWEKISSMSDADLQASSPAYAELRKSGMSEADAKREVGAKFSNNIPEIAIVGLIGALSGKYGPEAMVTGVAPKYATGRIGSAALGFMDEGPLQGGAEQVASNYGVQRAIPSQSLIENVGQNIVAEGMPGALMGFSHGGSKAQQKQEAPPELRAAAEMAQQPNSPLSRAAMAGNTPDVIAQRQEEQAAQAGDRDYVSAAETAPAQAKDPGARLAELEAIAKGTPSQQVTDDAGNPLTIPGEPGRFFTPEEKAEYDQLVAMKKATEEVRNADQPKTDEISARVDEISRAIRDNGTLQRMRDSGEDVKGLLKDLAIAKSKSTRQDQREQAIARVEFTLGMSDQSTSATAPARQQSDPILAALNDPAIDARDREELSIAYQASKNQALPERTRQNALDRAREIVGRYAAPAATQPASESAPAVLSDIPPLPGTPEESLRDAERREAGAYQFKAEGYPDEAQVLQQEADSLREEAAVRREQIEAENRVEQVAAPNVATPAGTGPSVLRRRKATLRQLVDNGLNRVERRDDGFYMTSQNGRQEFKLDGMADAQLARAAVAESIRAAAAQANTNPTEGQKTAGNYKVGEIKFDGLTLAVENPQGSTRSGVDQNGERWETVMPANYGYIRGSAMAADGDKVDIYLPDNARSGSPAWIIDQYNDDGTFDETKTVLGVRAAEEAAQIYDAGYSDGSGPRRRGAITEMSIDDFKAWAMSPAAKKPAGAQRAAPADIIQAAQREGLEIDGTMQVTVNGKPVEIGFVKELGKTESVSRGGRARRTSKKQGRVLQAIAQAFGKEIKFFYETGSDVGDGFIMPNDPGTIYLNESSSLSPIVVFGHELMHQLKRDNPEAHAAVEAVVAKRMKTKKVQEAYGKLGYQNGQILEELVSDLGGDLMADQSFWSDVFDEVHAKNDATAARKIIAKLAEFITRAINALSQNLRSYADTGAGSALVTDMDAIRAAFKDALADYIQAQGISKPAMQAEILKAGQEAKRSAARRAEETENFRRWFGDSKVVDSNGNPLVVYHGTTSAFTEFSKKSIGARDPGFFGSGFYFSPDADVAQGYADSAAEADGSNDAGDVIASYVSLRNPFVWDMEPGDGAKSTRAALASFGIERASVRGDSAALSNQTERSKFNSEIRAAGHDGVIVRDEDGIREVVAFEPTQIKSATENNGDYSLTDPNITRSAARDDALTVEAYHFSQQPRSVLTTGAFGTGLQGSDRDAIMAHQDQRLRQRLSFYVNKGTGVRPEAGVGGIAHKATLSNIYDGDADVKRLKQGRDRRGFESAVLDAGYSGYLTRLEGTQPGQVILLGRQTVQPEILGPRTNIPEAKTVPQPARRDMDAGDRIMANNSLPAGKMELPMWSRVLRSMMPDAHAQLDASGVFDGDDKALYKDELVARARKAAQATQSKAREAKIEKLAPVAERGERVTGKRVTMTADEKQAIEFSAETTGVSEKEIARVVREHKLAHPPAQDWAPLEFRKAKVDKGKLVYEYAKVPYSFNADEDGRSLKPGTPEYNKRVGAIARRMTDEVRRIHRRAAAGDKNAENILAQAGWYKAMRARLRHEFGGLGDLFADLLGATSPNTPVRDNWSNAVDSLRRATRGDFDELIPAWEAWADAIDARETELRAWFNDRMADGLSKKDIKALPEHKQMTDALAAARELPDALLPTKETGKKYGFNGRNVARAMVDLWRVVRDADPDIGRGGTAPKALNFSGNLIGFRERATIDVWAARMLQRLAGGLRVPSMAETGVSGDMRSDGSSTLQFGFGQDVFSDAVKRIRKDPELKTNDKLASVNDDDLQAVVWFVEKELWTVNNWTNAAGEGGSFELEASLTGSEQQQKIRELRRIVDSSRSTPAAKAEARRELASLERTVDRFIGGLSIQMSADTQGIDFVPADADMVRLSDEISTSIYEDESATAVLASKALSTEGRYGGIERSLDLEVVAREGYRPGALWKKMLETARDAKQDSTFLSRVLRDDESFDPLVHRPGVEIYFREAASREKLEKTLGELAKEGVEFLTVIVDGRRMTDATRGAMPPAVGVRMQYVPEFEQRYGMDDLKGLDDAALRAKIQEKADEMSAMAERVSKSVGDVSFASQFWYETNVAFSHEYQEKIDAIAAGNAEGAAQEVRGQEWSGQSVRAGIESADRQAREAAGAESDADVLGRDAAGAESQAERIEALKELIACLGR